MRRIKDKTKLVVECKLWANGRANYWNVFLWEDLYSFRRNTKEEDIWCRGLHMPCPTPIDPESGELYPNTKMGEIHFIKDHWNLERIAHELSHAQIHRLRCLCPSYKSVIERDEIDKEEIICYEFGKWVNELYNWLNCYNPIKGKQK